MYFLCCSMYFLCCSMYFCVVLCIVCFVSFSILFVCICVLNYCHWVATKFQLNIFYHFIRTACVPCKIDAIHSIALWGYSEIVFHPLTCKKRNKKLIFFHFQSFALQILGTAGLLKVSFGADNFCKTWWHNHNTITRYVPTRHNIVFKG